MLRGSHIRKAFAHREILSDLSFRVPEGKITVLAGADGAGKSTLMKILLGLVSGDGGRIFLQDDDIKGDHTRISRISGYMPEAFSLYPDLTVEENMNFFADIYPVTRKRRERLKHRLLVKTGMLEFRDRRAADLSGGMKQKLALSTILLSSPRIIFLDEPTTGVDPLSRIEFFGIIEELKAEGKTILMSTPYLDEAETGDQVIFLKNGTLLAEAGIQRLKREFPLQLYRLLPEGNLFKALDKIREQGTSGNLAYIRGKYLRLLKRAGDKIPRSVPFREVSRQPVSLEDIYLYYEQAADG